MDDQNDARSPSGPTGSPDKAPAAGSTPPSSPKRERRSGAERRKSVVDRRSGLDRRNRPAGLKLPDLGRRRGAGIRRPETRRAAEEGELTTEQFEFVMAIEEYKRVNQKPFPTWTEVLDVIKLLGYHKESDPEPEAESEPSPSEPAE